jgi:hypothetical protein
VSGKTREEFYAEGDPDPVGVNADTEGAEKKGTMNRAPTRERE